MKIKSNSVTLRTHSNDSEGFCWISGINALKVLLKSEDKPNNFRYFFKSPDHPGVQFISLKRDKRNRTWKNDFFKDRLEMNFIGFRLSPKPDFNALQVVFVDTPNSYTYGNRIHFIGCYKLREISGNKYIFDLVSQEYDLTPASGVKLAA